MVKKMKRTIRIIISLIIIIGIIVPCNASTFGVSEATLSFGTGTVVVGTSKEYLDLFLKTVNEGNSAGITDLYNEGCIFFFNDGTRAIILDEGLTVTKIMIAEGLYNGIEGWTIMEAVHKQRY